MPGSRRGFASLKPCLATFGAPQGVRTFLLSGCAILLMAAQAAPGVTGRVSPYPSVTRLYGPERTDALAIAQPVLAASSNGDLERVQRWADTISHDVPVVLAAGPGTRMAYERIMAALFEWAGANALDDVRGDKARSLVPRRVLGAAMGYLAVKPIADATGDIRRSAIEDWMGEQARRARTTFGSGHGSEGVLDYNNNLQATAATLAMAVFVATGDASLRDWSIESTREVLDRIDAQGFTGEVQAIDPARAEQRSHEVMIYVVGTATMAAANGDASLWTYRGRMASSANKPAILRAGLLLGRNLSSEYVTKDYAIRTGTTQAAYPGSQVVEPGIGGLMVPAGWLSCWLAPFLAQYRALDSEAPGMVRLTRALQFYRMRNMSQFNGALPLVGDVAYPARILRGPRAKLGINR